jgi:Maf-like protein
MRGRHRRERSYVCLSDHTARTPVLKNCASSVPYYFCTWLQDQVRTIPPLRAYGCDTDMTPTTCSRSIDERTIVHFADNNIEKIRAYVDSGEGIDKAGGFAAQVGIPFLAPLAAWD